MPGDSLKGMPYAYEGELEGVAISAQDGRCYFVQLPPMQAPAPHQAVGQAADGAAQAQEMLALLQGLMRNCKLTKVSRQMP